MSNTKEPMIMAKLPSRPWQVVATDLFDFKGCDNLLIVDYYSKLQNYSTQHTGCYNKMHDDSIDEKSFSECDGW